LINLSEIPVSFIFNRHHVEPVIMFDDKMRFKVYDEDGKKAIAAIKTLS